MGVMGLWVTGVPGRAQGAGDETEEPVGREYIWSVGTAGITSTAALAGLACFLLFLAHFTSDST